MADSESFTVGNWLVEPDLDRITRKSGSISLRPQVMALLIYLARRNGGVARTEDLLGSLWAGKVVTEGTLYNCVGELRQALANGEADQKYIETIPKKGYRLIAPVSGLDEARNSDGSKRDQGRDRSRVKITIVSCTVALFAVVVFWLIYEQGSVPARSEYSVAVLPFINMSSDPEQDYFSDGIAEEILNVLAEVPGLKVPARTSTFQFRGQNPDVRQIGERLNVATVLEGSIRKSGATLRITTQLVSTEDGFHLWSKTYDRPPEDIFAIQDEIAASIVEEMRDHFGLASSTAAPAARIATAAETYELYLQGLYHINTVFAPGQLNTNEEAAGRALGFFRQVTEADPDFALAWAGSAQALRWMRMMKQVPFAEASRKIEQFIARALDLGPNLAEVQFAVGEFSRQPEEALTHFNRAIEINPNYGKAHTARSNVLMGMHRYREAFDAAAIAASVDPLYQWSVEGDLYARFYQGKTEDLEHRMKASSKLWPDANALVVEAHISFELGHFHRFPSYQQRADVIPGFGVEPGNWIASAPRLFGDTYLALGLTKLARDWMIGRYDDAIFLSERRYGEAIEFLKVEFENGKNKRLFYYRWQPDIIASLVEAYLYAGRYEELTTFFDGLSWTATLFQLPNCCVTNPPWAEVAYTFALFQTGRAAQAQEWLAQMSEELEDRLAQGIDVPNHYYELARIRVMQGRIPDAFTALEQAVEKGWRRWYFDLDPILEPIREMPKFVTLKTRHDADIARMRNVVVAEMAANMQANER